MNQHSEIEKSQLRIAGLLRQHCERFRLLGRDEPNAHSAQLLALVSDLLDRFEDGLAVLARSAGSEANGGLNEGESQSLKRKQCVAFRENKR